MPTPSSSSPSVRAYTMGFILSILLTITPFLVVKYGASGGRVLLLTLVGFALLQLAVQLVFFLHLDRGRDRRWNIIAFAFAALVVFIVVVGSLWIMRNLNYHMMPQDMDKSIIQDEGLHH